MSKSSGSGFDSFRRAVGRGNKVGEKKSSGEKYRMFALSFKRIFSQVYSRVVCRSVSSRILILTLRM